MERLKLEITRYWGPGRWDWALSDGTGVVADHAVDVAETDELYAAFARLGRYLRLNVSPARPLSSEAQIVEDLGRWIGANLLGPIGPAMVDQAPATVEVLFPTAAQALMFRPWELAVVGDLPLARQDVSLVMVPPAEGPLRRKNAIGNRLRMLAVFSLPEGAPTLVLREQRQALVRLVDGIRKRSGKAIDLSVLQYDVNSGRLRDALQQGDGWDIVHFSGHGLIDGLVLEGATGGLETVPAAQLIHLLRDGRDQLKLLVLSSCNSAAAPPADILAARFGDAPEPEGDAAEPERTLPVLAEEAAGRLDCAVLAMRYTVDDDFSIELGEHLYSALLGSGQPLTRALQLALPKALGDRPRPGVPPLSVGIPALFGRRCADLTLNPPAAPPATYGVGNLKMTGFPREPEHLIGRSLPMGAGARLLSADGPAGIMFSGGQGLGKTACAVELAYRYEREFGALAWYGPSGEIRGSVVRFARALEDQLPGLEMADKVKSTSELEKFLPWLTELMERNAILIVIDGIDGLLSTDGYWRDGFWGRLVDALVDHNGCSRLVLTGRRPPQSVPSGLVVQPLAPLTPEESVLLARQLPTLGSLIHGSSGLPIARARLLLAEALTAAAGNPGVLRARDDELAAADLPCVVPDGPSSPEYVQLVDQCTDELSS
jgi:hypothetical protein